MWNGSYMAEGNGVYCSPANFATLGGDQWLAAGYVISTDDCGHTGYQNARVSPWVTNASPPPALNWNRIDDFGYLAQHLMAVESKYVIGRYYHGGPGHSFWNGCSTGGRQGLMEAQRYPADFNGILAGAPAVNWDQFMIAEMWPQLVMKWSGDELPTCKETLVNTTLAARCPDQDGQVDGVFDPRDCDVLKVLDSLTGTVTPCGTFTKADARVIQAIWQGPRLSGSQGNLLNGLPVWFGQEPGTDLYAGYEPSLGPGGGLGLATTVATPGGARAGAPFIPSDSWFQNWIKRSTSWTYTDETYQQYWQDFMRSAQYDSELAADNPGLRAFQRAGGKLIMWQGLADQQIFTGDSINYYNHAVQANGGREHRVVLPLLPRPRRRALRHPRPGKRRPGQPDAAGHRLGPGRRPARGTERERLGRRPARDQAAVPLPGRGRGLHRRRPGRGRQLRLRRQAALHQPVPAQRPEIMTRHDKPGTGRDGREGDRRDRGGW